MHTTAINIFYYKIERDSVAWRSFNKCPFTIRFKNLSTVSFPCWFQLLQRNLAISLSMHRKFALNTLPISTRWSLSGRSMSPRTTPNRFWRKCRSLFKVFFNQRRSSFHFPCIAHLHSQLRSRASTQEECESARSDNVEINCSRISAQNRRLHKL